MRENHAKLYALKIAQREQGPDTAAAEPISSVFISYSHMDEAWSRRTSRAGAEILAVLFDRVLIPMGIRDEFAGVQHAA